MAYMSQDRKATLVALAKPILKKYGIKATFGVHHHSTIVCNIKSGKLDFIGNYIAKIEASHRLTDQEKADTIAWKKKSQDIQVNHYHIDSGFDGDCAEFLKALKTALYTGNHDNSDPMTDYFDVGWYIDINVGKWNKPYVVEK